MGSQFQLVNRSLIPLTSLDHMSINPHWPTKLRISAHLLASGRGRMLLLTSCLDSLRIHEVVYVQITLGNAYVDPIQLDGNLRFGSKQLELAEVVSAIFTALDQ